MQAGAGSVGNSGESAGSDMRTVDMPVCRWWLKQWTQLSRERIW